MPPRYAYWTILVDNQPTAFRAGAKEDLLPTFNRLKEKNPSAVMMWFQNGKLWPSRVDAQEAMLARGEMGRRGDARQPARRSFSEGGGGGFRERHKVGTRERSDRPERSDRRERPDWTPKSQAPSPKSPEKLDWKPKGAFTPAPKRSDRREWKPRSEAERAFRPKSQAPSPKPRGDWKPKASFDRERKPRSFARPAWKPSGDETKAAKPEWKPKGSFTRERKPDWKPKGSFSRSERPEWTPKSQAPSPKSPEKRKWVPKEEYKKSLGIEAKRDGKWRPGGEHRDPRQKYKDAKKAKWTKFKKTIRTKWEGKSKKKS